ncbi:biofilm regulation phosphoprotein SiaC [Chitinimonas sp.]|uniref:biofilm regulation phosphoprotein SiaC n=1 Tax=Chitinimonas sp. TaxID=1934313 RepID=UPI0035B1E418
MDTTKTSAGKNNLLHLAKTQSTPAVEGHWGAGVLSMQGDSYPENSYELYGQVIGWVERYLAECERPLTLELRLVYLNTSSIKVMMDIFDLLEDAHRQGRNVAVNWYYDPRNERVAELAGEFKEDCSFAFEIRAIGE